MEEFHFPPNLEDAELWLSSDILLPFHYLPSHVVSPLLPPPSHPLPILQRVNPVIRDVPSTRLPPRRCFGFHGGGVHLHPTLHDHHATTTRQVFSRSNPFYEFRIQPQQVDSSSVEKRRGRTVQHCLQTRECSIRINGLGVDGGLNRGSSGGTGVFHPRIVKPSTTPLTHTDVKRSHAGRQEIAVAHQQRDLTRSTVDVNKQEDCYYHLPPEMGLPKDWTY